MSANEWIDFALVAARDFQVLLFVLLCVGLFLFIASFVNIPKFEVKPERQRMVFRYGVALMVIFGLPLAILQLIPKGVEVHGFVKYDDGQQVANALVIVGDDSMRTTSEGEFDFYNVSRNHHQISVLIKSRSFDKILDMPTLFWKTELPITIPRIGMNLSGIVEDENKSPIEGSWVNLSGGREDSRKTDALGKFSFGKLELPFVPPKPLVLSVRLPNELLPRVQLTLEIPSEPPYEIDSPISVPPKDKVDVSGRVIVQDNYTDWNFKNVPFVIVIMGDQSNKSDSNGNYIIHNVPINTRNYTLRAADWKLLCNHSIIPRLSESSDGSSHRDLNVFKYELG